MANPNPPPPPMDTRWKPGQSGNPGGMAKGTRSRLNANFLNTLADDFLEHGKAAIIKCRESDPAKYVQIVAALMPKQIEQSQPLDEMTDEQLITSLDYLRRKIADRTGNGVPASHLTQ